CLHMIRKHSTSEQRWSAERLVVPIARDVKTPRKRPRLSALRSPSLPQSPEGRGGRRKEPTARPGPPNKRPAELCLCKSVMDSTHPQFPERREGVGCARERQPREAAVFIHAADQVLDRLEGEFVPDPIDEGHIDGLAVKIAVEIEQE